MNEKEKPNDNASDTESRDRDGEQRGIGISQPGTANQGAAKQDSQNPDNHPRVSVWVRIWHALWRKRIFFHRTNQPSPNWAEKTSMFITGGILLAAAIQAGIYWKQAGIMEQSLHQNDRSIRLGRGQLAVAGRNATTAEDTLGEMKKGGADTHDLAVAAGKQAEAAKVANNTTREALTSVQRAFVFFIATASATKTIVNNKTTELNFTLPHKNTGATPTEHAEA